MDTYSYTRTYIHTYSCIEAHKYVHSQPYVYTQTHTDIPIYKKAKTWPCKVPWFLRRERSKSRDRHIFARIFSQVQGVRSLLHAHRHLGDRCLYVYECV